MKKINFRIIILIVFIICIYLLKKTMFIKGDIFYYQMVSVVKGEKYFLAKIHLVRFLAIFPFYLSTYLSEKISILIQGVVIYFYAKPVLKLQNLNTYILIILVLLLFSYRTSIVALSLPYFHMYQKSKKKKYLFFSFLFSTLSSATVLNFIIIYLVYNYKKLYNKIPFVILILVFFIPSFQHKVVFFTQGGDSYFITMFNRSFLVMSILFKDYMRIMIIIFVILIFIYELISIIIKKKITARNIEYILPIFYIFMEGLGVYSYLISYSILISKSRKSSTNICY